MAGIEQTKDVLDFSFSLANVVIKNLRDGVQPEDIANIIVDVMKDKDVILKLKKAIEDIDELPSELTDLSITEIMDLVGFCIKNAVSLLKK